MCLSRRRKTAGATLVETLGATIVGALAVVGVASLLIGEVRGTAHINVELDSAAQASAALRIMNFKLEEAKSITVNNPTWITASFPVVQSDGTYDNTRIDNNSALSYYLGSIKKGPNAKGTELVEQQPNGQRRVICENVTFLQFSLPNANTLNVSLQTTETARDFQGTSSFLNRQIFLRNN